MCMCVVNESPLFEWDETKKNQTYVCSVIYYAYPSLKRNKSNYNGNCTLRKPMTDDE